MMKRVVMVTVAAMALAAPALAQQSTPLTDQQKQAVQAAIDKYIKGINAKDAKGLANLYTDDAVVVGTYAPQPLVGRAAIEKYLSENPLGTNFTVEADWKSSVSLGNNRLLVVGTWADTVPSMPVAQAGTTQQSGSSQPPSQLSLKPGDREHGSWTAIDELRGGEVLIRMLSYNVGLAGPMK
jgi:uncharacterized protein (TIGR02246 family)